ncbi:MAG: putative toxin-antitoxin system toxin component, PIN family [Deltaproteobacteria bacterium]|nr:putative toxin-antitoxin system toxin component, PIN family [Deltaproteobacteria bacterium]
MRILLDTSVLVAAFATRGFCHDILQIVLAEHRLLVGETVLQELERILADKLAAPEAHVSEVIGFVREHADVVAPVEPASWPATDPADRWIAAAAVRGRADVLVTGGRDLLEAAPGGDLRVVSPRGLWELLRSARRD